jgi:hypothetical protein
VKEYNVLVYGLILTLVLVFFHGLVEDADPEKKENVFPGRQGAGLRTQNPSSKHQNTNRRSVLIRNCQKNPLF